MKRLILIASLFATPALAQQTSCQIIGNQVYCYSYPGVQPSVRGPDYNALTNSGARIGQAFAESQRLYQERLMLLELARQRAELERLRSEQGK